jgi:[acyl-carrier-protein] S-malonyltransferase
MCNVDAVLITTAEQARDALIRQVTGAVQWEKAMRGLIALSAQSFVEAGPGKVLCGLMKQIDRSRNCFNAEDESSLQKTVTHFSSASPKPD